MVDGTKISVVESIFDSGMGFLLIKKTFLNKRCNNDGGTKGKKFDLQIVVVVILRSQKIV